MKKRSRGRLPNESGGVSTHTQGHSTDNPITEAMELADVAESLIRQARHKAKLAAKTIEGEVFPQDRAEIAIELGAAARALDQAKELLRTRNYASLFYPAPQYRLMHDYSQPDGIARPPELARPKHTPRKVRRKGKR